MNPLVYLDLKRQLIEGGYADEVDRYGEAPRPPKDADVFFREYAFVICNSGMRATVAVPIYRKIIAALEGGQPASVAFRHPGKVAAIQEAWERREERFKAFLAADDKLGFLRALPWIGPITVYHLAKEVGLDVAKPDRHLVRIAAASGEDVESLCLRLAAATGDRLREVDYVLWRSAERGLVPAGCYQRAPIA